MTGRGPPRTGLAPSVDETEPRSRDGRDGAGGTGDVSRVWLGRRRIAGVVLFRFIVIYQEVLKYKCYIMSKYLEKSKYLQNNINFHLGIVLRN